ncbi:MAG: SDR family NAD(P)-dependent oxidoreductase, partial [Planctomycetota bacterium]
MGNSKAKKKAGRATRQRKFALESQSGCCDELKNHVAIVTGAGSGLGKSIAIGLARAGARVGLFDIEGKSAGETEAIIKKELPQAEAAAIRCDVTDEEDVDKAFDALLKKWGG